MRGSKFGNNISQHDGYTFMSDAEMERYETLRMLQMGGAISGLEVHPRYEILAEFRDWTGKKHPARKYEADFAYWEDGFYVVEDVKGVETDVFKIKRDMFMSRYPEYHFKVEYVKKRGR